jgi:hypothetical protein
MCVRYIRRIFFFKFTIFAYLQRGSLGCAEIHFYLKLWQYQHVVNQKGKPIFAFKMYVTKYKSKIDIFSRKEKPIDILFTYKKAPRLHNCWLVRQYLPTSIM